MENISFRDKALERFNLNLFVDKNGRVFTVEFSIPDEAFQKLDGFPKNTLKNFYHKLIKEKCEAFKEVIYKFWIQIAKEVDGFF